MLVGSRSEERAVDFAAKIGAEGMDNATAAAACDIAVLTVPYQAQRTTAHGAARDPPGQDTGRRDGSACAAEGYARSVTRRGRAAHIAQTVLGEGVRVVSAFQNVSAGICRIPLMSSTAMYW